MRHLHAPSVVRPNDTDFTSCEAQREACLELIRAHAPEGWVPIDERFDDAGESGATIDRPALARLLERIASGGVDRVGVQRLDRLTRSVADYATLVGTFKRRGTKLTIVVGDIHMGDVAMSDLVLNILATFAEFERELIGERLRDARAALRRRGIRNAGRVPFGYSSDPLSHQLVVRPEEAPVVKRMFEMAAAGTPPSAIATWINAQGENNRRVLSGRQAWSPKAVLRILSNRVYLGRMGAVADAHEAQTVLTSYAPIWEVLFPETVRRSVAQLVWEVRWDGLKNEFAVVLDETAIAEAHASIMRREEERANRPKPRRRKRRRARPR